MNLPTPAFPVAGTATGGSNDSSYIVAIEGTANILYKQVSEFAFQRDKRNNKVIYKRCTLQGKQFSLKPDTCNPSYHIVSAFHVPCMPSKQVKAVFHEYQCVIWDQTWLWTEDAKLDIGNYFVT